MSASTGRMSAERNGFFVEKTRSSLTRDFVDEVLKLEKKLRSISRSEILNQYLGLSSRAVKIEFYSPGKYVIKTEVGEAAEKGYISPSMFNKYRRCARELAIEIMETKTIGGTLVTVDQLRSYLKGFLAHRLYYERVAYGDTEVRVESATLRIVGYIDEVRKELGIHKVFEFKSSHKPDLVGAGLQVMSYMLAYADQNSVDLQSIEGYVVTLRGIYRVKVNKEVFDEYAKRLRKIVEIALSGDVNMLPPRLSSDLSARCNDCPYRGRCVTLPDNYRTYQRFFEAVGFKKLVEKSSGSNLFSYLNKP